MSGPVDVMQEMQDDIDALEKRVLNGEFSLSRGYEKVNRLRGIRAAVAELIEAMRLAVRQNSHDMLMTGEEIRACESALARVGCAK